MVYIEPFKDKHYIFTQSHIYLPKTEIFFNEMNNSKHDNLVRILKNSRINNGSQLVVWNMDYGVRGNNSCIGEIDTLDYNNGVLSIYEVKSSKSNYLFEKGKRQLNRVIDRYIREFNDTFEVDLNKICTFMVFGNKGRSAIKYNVYPHIELDL